MHQRPSSLASLCKSALCATALWAACGSALAQGLLENPAPERTLPEPPRVDEEIPVLFEGELEDIGPQYLLRPGKPPHDWFYPMLDGQLVYTSNPTLAEDSVAEGTDLLILTAQIETRTRAQKYFGGNTIASLGMRYQVFRYGSLSDPDEQIGGLPASASDFEAANFYGYFKWTRDAWTVNIGLRWTQLYNDSSDGGFYKELAPNWSISRSFSLSERSLLRINYMGNWFFSESKNFDLPRDDFNDRITHMIGASLMHQLFERFTVSPGITLSHATYTNNLNGDRTDLTFGASLFFTYEPVKHASLRFQTGYQKRNSDGLGVADYDNYDFGFGGTFTYSF